MRYRVWPDGTVQELSEPAYSYMSDDFVVVDAEDELDALDQVFGGTHDV